MLECTYEARSDGYCYCTRCPNRMRGTAPTRCHSICKRENAPATIEDVTRCRHRSLQTIRYEPTNLCASRGGKIAVYACELHGECTLRRFKHNQGPAICLGCEDQTP